MTDRIRQLGVLLDDDYRDEEESLGVIIAAIKMIKGVADVKKGDVLKMEDYAARTDFRHAVGLAISELAVGQDQDFVADVTAAYAKLQKKRGY